MQKKPSTSHRSRPSRASARTRDHKAERLHRSTSERRPLKIDEAAGWLSISRSTICGLLRSGDLSTIPIGRSVRLPHLDTHGKSFFVFTPRSEITN